MDGHRSPDAPGAGSRLLHGPAGLPLVGSGLAFWRDPLGFLQHNAAAYGDAVRCRFGPRTIVIFRHPDQVRAVLLTEQHHFVKGGAGRWFRTFAGQGLFTSEDPLHRRQRRLAQPAFHQSRIPIYGPIMASCVARRCERWSEGQVIDLDDEMRQLTMTIVCKAMFDADVEWEAHEVGQALTAIMQLFSKFASARRYLQWLPGPARSRLRAATKRLDETIFRIITERRAKPSGGSDFLSILMAASDENGERLSDTQLRDELVTIFIAGHETAANALTWTWSLLATHPAIEARVVEEVDRVIGSRAPRAEDAATLPLVERVFAESLRLYPPLWVLGRRARQDVNIDGYRVKAGTLVLVSPYLTQRDPRFFPEPDRFLPDRWTPEMRGALHKFAYFPFGGGSRKCLGDAFAWLEARLILATAAQRWRLEPQDFTQPTPRPLATLRPPPGVRMRLHPRRPAASRQAIGVDVSGAAPVQP